jgi:hypothetical protein
MFILPLHLLWNAPWLLPTVIYSELHNKTLGSARSLSPLPVLRPYTPSRSSPIHSFHFLRPFTPYCLLKGYVPTFRQNARLTHSASFGRSS